DADVSPTPGGAGAVDQRAATNRELHVHSRSRLRDPTGDGLGSGGIDLDLGRLDRRGDRSAGSQVELSLRGAGYLGHDWDRTVHSDSYAVAELVEHADRPRPVIAHAPTGCLEVQRHHPGMDRDVDRA